MITFLRMIKFAFQHFFRNFWLSLATISILVLTLFTLDLLLALNLTADAALTNLEERVDVSVTFKVGAEESEVKEAMAYLQGLVEIKDVSMNTPEEILAEFKTKHADNPTILSSLEEVESNPFGYRLVIKARSADGYPLILEALDHPSFREKIEEKNFSDHQALLERISGLADKVRFAGIFIFTIFLLIAVLIILNTVRVTIFVHREEIAIMRLVGATSRFISWPYLLEALTFSILSVIISAAIVIPIALSLDPLLASYFETTIRFKDLFIAEAPWVFGLEFIGLAWVCLASTAVAMRKYLRV